MKLLVVGTPEDLAGFALAGVEASAEAIAPADEETLVIVSAELAVGGWRLAGNRLTVVLPPTANRQPPTGSH